MGDNLDKVFRALADPRRRLLLDRLHAENGQTLGQLCEHLDMTRQAVTKHLKVLSTWPGMRRMFHAPHPPH